MVVSPSESFSKSSKRVSPFPEPFLFDFFDVDFFALRRVVDLLVAFFLLLGRRFATVLLSGQVVGLVIVWLLEPGCEMIAAGSYNHGSTWEACTNCGEYSNRHVSLTDGFSAAAVCRARSSDFVPRLGQNTSKPTAGTSMVPNTLRCWRPRKQTSKGMSK
jgi:hypothetical protein